MANEIEKPNWIERALVIIEAAEEGIPLPSWLKGDEFPVWVGNVLAAVLKASMPGTKWKDPKSWTPGELGAFLGGKTVYWQIEERYDPSWLLKLSRDLKKEGDRIGTAIIIKYLRALWVVGLPQFREALIQCLSLVVDAPHHEKIRFFRAYTKAIQQPQNADGSPTRATTATPIYSFFLIYWRAVEKLESIHKLHDILRKVFGDTVVGDQKRVEKICERIGLSFAKSLQAEPVPKATDKSA